MEVLPSPEQEKSPDILVRSGHMAPRTEGQRVPYLSIVMTGEGGGGSEGIFWVFIIRWDFLGHKK